VVQGHVLRDGQRRGVPLIHHLGIEKGKGRCT
jgi:hypothetical protein